MKSLSVAVLGLGSIGMRHARNAKALGHHVLGFDPSPAAQRKLETEGVGEVVAKESALARADAVVIASPNRFHLADLGEAIVVAKPALVEKPLGHDASVAAAVVKSAKSANIVVAAAHNLRFRAVVRRAREMLEEGRIGRPVWASFECASWLPDWRPGSDYRRGYTADPETGGVIFDNIHEIDLAVHLLGPAQVRAAVAKRSGLLELESEDIADIVMEHDSGCQTRVHVDYVTRPRRRGLTVAGTGGVLAANLRSGAVSCAAPNDEPALVDIAPFDPNEEYLALMADFLAAVTTGSHPVCPAEDALNVLTLACEARWLAGLPHSTSARGVADQRS